MTEAAGELLACPNPWCMRVTAPVPIHGRAGWRVVCACGVTGPSSSLLDGATAAWNTRAALGSPPVGEVREATGWLIEDADEPKWLTLKPAEALWSMVFTPDSLEAIRFARRSDAEDYVSCHLDDAPVRITEHSWPDLAALASRPDAPVDPAPG